MADDAFAAAIARVQAYNAAIAAAQERNSQAATEPQQGTANPAASMMGDLQQSRLLQEEQGVGEPTPVGGPQIPQAPTRQFEQPAVATDSSTFIYEEPSRERQLEFYRRTRPGAESIPNLEWDANRGAMWEHAKAEFEARGVPIVRQSEMGLAESAEETVRAFGRGALRGATLGLGNALLDPPMGQYEAGREARAVLQEEGELPEDEELIRRAHLRNAAAETAGTVGGATATLALGGGATLPGLAARGGGRIGLAAEQALAARGATLPVQVGGGVIAGGAAAGTLEAGVETLADEAGRQIHDRPGIPLGEMAARTAIGGLFGGGAAAAFSVAGIVGAKLREFNRSVSGNADEFRIADAILRREGRAADEFTGDVTSATARLGKHGLSGIDVGQDAMAAERRHQRSFSPPRAVEGRIIGEEVVERGQIVRDAIVEKQAKASEQFYTSAAGVKPTPASKSLSTVVSHARQSEAGRMEPGEISTLWDQVGGIKLGVTRSDAAGGPGSITVPLSWARSQVPHERLRAGVQRFNLGTSRGRDLMGNETRAQFVTFEPVQRDARQTDAAIKKMRAAKSSLTDATNGHNTRGLQKRLHAAMQEDRATAYPSHAEMKLQHQQELSEFEIPAGLLGLEKGRNFASTSTQEGSQQADRVSAALHTLGTSTKDMEPVAKFMDELGLREQYPTMMGMGVRARTSSQREPAVNMISWPRRIVRSGGALGEATGTTLGNVAGRGMAHPAGPVQGGNVRRGGAVGVTGSAVVPPWVLDALLGGENAE